MGLPYPTFDMIHDAIRDSGKGKTALLYKYVEKLIGKFNVRHQLGPDCVSHGMACAIDCLKATEIVLKGDFEEWLAETCTEDIYGGSRIWIGKGQLGGGGGSIGAWAAQYCQKYGTLARLLYGNIDLRKYNWSLGENWGDNGPPQALLPYIKEHPVKTFTQVTNAIQARDAIANGYPVTVASDQGFSARRDQDGFAAPQGSWMHEMCFIGVDDASVGISGGRNRPGLLCANSWSNWNSGPKRLDQPDGSFWVDYEVADRMLRQGDSFSYTDYNGFQPKELNLDLF